MKAVNLLVLLASHWDSDNVTMLQVWRQKRIISQAERRWTKAKSNKNVLCHYNQSIVSLFCFQAIILNSLLFFN